MNDVTIVGGGLAGSEAAWQLADRGLRVRLIEMRPHTPTGAHRTGGLGEIVCSNSFKSTLIETASGLLKREMEILGCRLLEVAHRVRVPAGHALGIDRDLFSQAVTEALEHHPNVTIERREVTDLDLPAPAVLATGPLTGTALSGALREHCSSDHLYFYDAIAPSLDGDSIDFDQGFWASRYGKGEADYFNVPLDREQYLAMVAFIRSAETVGAHDFEEEKYFEACLPIEVLAARGDDTLRYGPLKPRGLVDPRTGREPYACIQLRQENRSGALLGMVGFQTRMKWPQQSELIKSLPGMAEVKILRYGTIHRNIFLNVPELCDRPLRDRRRPGLYYAGQICGVEGYVESIASAIVVALAIAAQAQGRAVPPLPDVTMLGALMSYVHTPNRDFQPMNANMGLLPRGEPLGRDARRGGRRGARRARNEALSARATEAMAAWRSRNGWLFAPTAAPSR